MIESQIQLEATRDAKVRKQIRETVLREVDFKGNESTAEIAVKSPRATEKMDAWKSLLRTGQVTRIETRKLRYQKTISRRWFQHGQNVQQTRTMILTRDHSDLVETRQQSEINLAVKRTSTREQSPLFTYRF
ncbi:hypothetical protein [Gimesia algae]|nr:hypothetical protein [Gimesia algae]